jgi:sporulation protein YlmC with PRC-barrel domain
MGRPGNIVSCNLLTGDTVVDIAAVDLGRLEQIVIDVPSGRIVYAVLACGGVFGIGAKFFAVPWDALSLDAEGQRFVADIARETFEGER